MFNPKTRNIGNVKHIHEYGYDKEVKYNIPKQPSKEKVDKPGKMHKPKYNPERFQKVGSTIFKATNIDKVAKYLFIRREDQEHLTKLIEDGEDFEFALKQTIQFEQERLKMIDEKMKEKYMSFDDDDKILLKVYGIDPDANLEFHKQEGWRNIIDINGNFVPEHFKKLMEHLGMN